MKNIGQLRTFRPNPIQQEYFPFGGGLNLVDPPIATPLGFVIGGSNYEVGVGGGYKRILGYERYDGHPLAHLANYWILDFTAGTVAFTVGQTVSGATGSGVILAVVVESGAFATSDAAGYLAITQLTPGFVNSEIITDGGGGSATASGTETISAAPTDALHNTYGQAAQESYRGLVSAPTGSGANRGGFVLNGEVYTFRDNAGGTAGQLFKATSTGWVAQSLGERVNFTGGGTVEPAEGNTLTQGIVTATVERIVLLSGTWAGSDAAGYFVLSGRSGGSYTNAAATVGSASVTLSGAESAITLPPGGRYEIVTYNFFGHASTIRAYGVNGVGTAFEWDGTVFAPIETGMTTDAPIHVAAHKGHLFLAFPGGSLQHSSFGDPLRFSAVTGAAELALGEEITNLLVMPGEALVITTRNISKILYGQDVDTWNLVTFSDTTGGAEWTLRRIAGGVLVDDRGITQLVNVQAFGDFQDAVISHKIEPYFVQQKSKVIASCIVREKNQYRLFFNDNAALYITFDQNKPVGIMTVDMPTHPEAIWWGEDPAGKEIIFFGDSTGQVFKMDSGNNFDGVAVDAFLKTAYSHQRSPNVKKHYRSAVFEYDAPDNFSISIAPSFTYDTQDIAEHPAETNVVGGLGGIWNVSNWDEFLWGGGSNPVGRIGINGQGENVSFTFLTSLTYERPHAIYGAIVQYTRRGVKR